MSQHIGFPSPFLHHQTTPRRLSLWLCALLLCMTGCSELQDMPGIRYFSEEDIPLPAKRDRIAVFNESEPLSADTALPEDAISLPDTESQNLWLQIGGNTMNSMGNLAGPSPLIGDTESTSAGDAEGWNYMTASQPVVGEKMVYAMDAMGYVSAHDRTTLDDKWMVLLSKQEPEEPLPGGGLALAGDTLFAASGSGMLAALSATDGSTRWKRHLYLPIRSAPKLADGNLYLLTADNRLQAYAQDDGRLLWEHRAITDSAGGLHTPSAAVAGKGVVAPFASGEVYLLRMNDGREVWRAQVESNRRTDAGATLNHFVGQPFLADGRIYIANHAGAITALDFRSGLPVWHVESPGVLGMWMAGNALFVLMQDLRIAAIQREDGRVVWVQHLPTLDDTLEDTTRWIGPAVINSEVWLFSNAGDIVRLNALNGKTVQIEDMLPSGIADMPAITQDALWFITQDAKLVQLK